jgi:hypothetical protein
VVQANGLDYWCADSVSIVPKDMGLESPSSRFYSCLARLVKRRDVRMPKLVTVLLFYAQRQLES